MEQAAAVGALAIKVTTTAAKAEATISRARAVRDPCPTACTSVTHRE